MKENALLFSYYDISYETDLGLTERLSQALQELARIGKSSLSAASI